MLIDELIEKAFSDGYEYALMEQREFAYLDGMVGTSFSRSEARAARKSLATPPRSPKPADMYAKLKKPAWLSSKANESALRAISEAKKQVLRK